MLATLPDTFCVLMAKKDFVDELARELALIGIPVLLKSELLFLVAQDAFETARRRPIWTQDFWPDCHVVEFPSIAKAQQKLKSMAKRWVHASLHCHRRGELICEGLPRIKKKRLEPFIPLPDEAFGVFGLLSEKELFYSLKPHSQVPFGYHEFVEDKKTPPSRAYLKLWEVFSIHRPHLARELSGKTVFDLGACPGGWSYVLSQVGCQVYSFDKAPLDEKIAKLSNVHFRQESAFGLSPSSVPQPFAIFSDIICYPARLFDLVEKWRATGVKKFVCTIKFQKETDYETVEKFLAIPGSEIIHLYHNQHEATWIMA
ncbi:MAG: hypothetical protein A2X86_08615 [Bdellovibrionales bacterium GWA2_49_15]|nr:MAG: hypothetical protein A2X86_08615 [Bdellovibrionales bacterium GWA2_49_15]HAZ11174.1 hypothetical protein [Bdellovibrionales bacterium]